MDISTVLRLTPKGREELTQRTHKLGLKVRSLLILLNSPQTVDAVFKKSVLPAEESDTILRILVAGGFVAEDQAVATSPAQPMDDARMEPAPQKYTIDREIILSEAKFLLTDFCVDCFGTEAQDFVSAIRTSTSVQQFSDCLTSIWSATKARHPQRMSQLDDLVKEINATA